MFEWRCSFSQQDKDMVHPYNSHLNQQFMLVIVLFEPSKQTHNTRNNPVHSLNLVLPSLVFSKIRDFKAENVIFFFLKNGLSLCNKGWVDRNKRSRMFNTKTVCCLCFDFNFWANYFLYSLEICCLPSLLQVVLPSWGIKIENIYFSNIITFK